MTEEIVTIPDEIVTIPDEIVTIPEEAPRRRVKRRRPDLSDTVPAIPVAAFRRLVREITQDIKPDMRWEAEALEALQVDAEAYLMKTFQTSDGIRGLCRSKTLNWDHWRQGSRTLEG
jgi:histone H3/H4